MPPVRSAHLDYEGSLMERFALELSLGVIESPTQFGRSGAQGPSPSQHR